MTIELDSPIREELNNRLKHKAIYEDRLIALERFNEIHNKKIMHGLNVSTDLTFIEYSGVFHEGNTDIILKKYSKTKNNIPEIIELKFEGHYDDNNIIFTSLKELIHNNKFDDMLKDKILKYINKSYQHNSTIKLEYLHRTLSDVNILILKKGYDSSELLEIFRECDGNSYNHLLIIFEDNITAKIYINTLRKNSNNKINRKNNNMIKHNNLIITDFTDIISGQNCELEIIEHRQTIHSDIIYGKKTVELNTGSNINWTSIDTDTHLTLLEQNINLKGDNSSSRMNNLIIGTNSEYMIKNISEHNGRNTKSLIQSKCGLKNSKAIIKGLIKISPDAENSDGYQKTDIILLDNHSRGIAIPDLEIHNDKVKCTHGATVTKIDEEKIFYLQSRGITHEDAEKILLEGFYEKILSDISSDYLRKKIFSEVIDREGLEDE